MKRREFLAGATTAAAATLLTEPVRLEAGRPSQTTSSHPLYFDGLTFLSNDLADVAKSGLSGFVWDVSAGEMVEGKYVRRLIPSLKSMAEVREMLRKNEAGLFLATRGSEVKEASAAGRTAVFFQLQSCEPLEGDVGLMGAVYEMGVRILQLTHHFGNAFSGGALDKTWTGLSPLGVKAVEKMNELGIIPDLSHGNDVMGADVLKTSKKSVVITHTGCRTIVRNARCASDEVIRGVAASGGVVGIFSMSFWLTSDPVPTVDSYIRQLEHVIRIGGIDAVGISNDYTIAGELPTAALKNDNALAVKNYFPWWKSMAAQGLLGFEELPKHCVIPEMNNVRRFEVIQGALEKKGYPASQVEKIMGANWVRVLTECLG